MMMMSPLSFPIQAADKARLEAVKYLLDQGASIKPTKKGGKSALELAAETNHLEVLKHLLSRTPPGYEPHDLGSAMSATSDKVIKSVLEAELSNHGVNTTRRKAINSP